MQWMHGLQPPLLAAFSPRWVECSKSKPYLKKHACRPDACILKWLKLETISRHKKKAVRHTNLCVWQLVFWLLVVLSNYFTKFHDFSMIIKFFQIPWFFHAWNFFWCFSRFSMISRNGGTLPIATWPVLHLWVSRGRGPKNIMNEYKESDIRREAWAASKVACSCNALKCSMYQKPVLRLSFDSLCRNVFK